MALLAFVPLDATAATHEFRILSFFGVKPGDGYEPYAAATLGPGGDLYGSTANGGTVVKSGACALGCGTLYRIERGTRATIHNFSGADGDQPVAPLLAASDGRLYGSTTGGEHRARGGTLFSLKPDGADFRTLHEFDGSGGAGNPQGGLIELRDGFLYGTTVGGLPVSGKFPSFAFRVRRDGSGFTVLHRFYINRYSGAPTAALLLGSDGRLYGTTGISTEYVAQTIFRMDRDGSHFEKLHAIEGRSSDYQSPGLIEPTPGRLYGALAGANGPGEIYSLALDGSDFRTLHRFDDRDGGDPMGTLVLGADGELYGTTFGGLSSRGSVFAIRLDGSDFRTVHVFGLQPHDGGFPRAGLTVAADGSLAGTTQMGGLKRCPPFAGCGTVYRIFP